MAKQNSKQSFWTTLPGILTGCATMITAIATLIGALYTASIIRGKQDPTPTPITAITESAPNTRPLDIPTPTELITESVPSTKALYIQGAVTEPPSVASGEKATIHVTVVNDENQVVEGATIFVESGGGMFLETATTAYDPNGSLQGPFSTSGQTDSNGVYTAWWVCNPCAAGYEMSVKASKEGYTEAIGELTINIH